MKGSYSTVWTPFRGGRAEAGNGHEPPAQRTPPCRQEQSPLAPKPTRAIAAIPKPKRAIAASTETASERLGPTNLRYNHLRSLRPSSLRCAAGSWHLPEAQHSGDTLCKVTPVILHGVVAPETVTMGRVKVPKRVVVLLLMVPGCAVEIQR